MSETDYAQNYARMSDDELTRIYEDRASLVPEAMEAIEAELSRRSLTVEDPQEQPSSLNRSVPASAPRKGANWWKGGLSSLGLALVVRALVSAYFSAPPHDNSATSQIVAEMNADGAANADFRVKFRDIMKQRPYSFAEFQQQMNQLAILLDSAESRSRKGVELFRQVRKDFPPEASALLPLYDRLFDDDAKMFAIEREEIACSKALTTKPARERSRFQIICQVPVYDKLRPLAEDEDLVARELQKQGVKLPDDVQAASR